MRWHVPTAEEISFATELLQEFLVSEFDAIHRHVSGTKTLTRYSDTYIHTYTQRDTDSILYYQSVCGGCAFIRSDCREQPREGTFFNGWFL